MRLETFKRLLSDDRPRRERRDARGKLEHNGKCEAKTRAGTPCRRWPCRLTGRCRLHGGLSTGPRTAAGKARVAAAQKARWAKWRAERDEREAAEADEREKDEAMKLQTLDRILHSERSGRPCGARLAGIAAIPGVPGARCAIEGFLPSGRCWQHGAAPRSPKGIKRVLTKKERLALQKRIRGRMVELGLMPDGAEMKAIEKRLKLSPKLRATLDSMQQDDTLAHDLGAWHDDLVKDFEANMVDIPDWDPI